MSLASSKTSSSSAPAGDPSAGKPEARDGSGRDALPRDVLGRAEALERRGRGSTAPGTFRPCGVIPTYDNPHTIERVAVALREALREAGVAEPRVFVVDDGGGDEAKAALERVRWEPDVEVVVRPRNGGKGAAVKDGLRAAYAAGYSHALQVDADGQHALEDVGALLAAARETPDALVLGRPVFDASAPSHRRVLRLVSVFWTSAATLLDRGRIADPMCGFRVYPLGPAVRVADRCGDRMDFDPEIAVRLVWEGCPVRNVPTKVRYLGADEGGVSHYRAVHDNVLVSLLYARLVMLRMLGMRDQL
ncbi:MAG: glycosyltransferase family 2 protein [Sandaracinus sp.]|nr:glycosyltransferase family 2 protein [Sandaracinus sp.]